MGTENWTLKGTKLITSTKKQRLKSRVKVRLSKIQYLKKNHKNYKIYIYEICFKSRIFSFLQGYKNGN